MINSSNFLCADNASNYRVIEVPEETALRIKVNEGDVSVAFWEVTEENFQQCSILNGKSIIPLHTADGFILLEEMLSLGNNYFLAIVNDLAAKAMPTLRVNMTVKASICIEEKNGLQCSGRGQCITKPSAAAFYCDCEEGHIGLFCEEFDGCSSLQCQNNATCLDVKQGNTERNFTCVCSP
ncbi:hypothetical protein chiPu_0021110, partial [Chiloscyllium punctatum]|nr:hypothetical protein [Chiloscyllium punctatum]